MAPTRFSRLAQTLLGTRTRRTILGRIAALPLAGPLGFWLGHEDVSAKKRKKKHKKKCGKPGSKPVKGKCCSGSILVDSRCQRCNVCQSGCSFSVLQAAIDAANTGDTIAVCPGTYGGDLSIAKDVRLVGAGGGTTAADTIVQGSGTSTVPAVKITSSTVSLEKLRITGGGSGDGSGIRNDGGTLELITCTVAGNAAGGTGVGGGICNLNTGTLVLKSSTVSGNSAVGGGGISNNGAGSTVTADAASRVTGNTAANQTLGGGIHSNGGTITLASTAIVSGNKPNNCGGPTAVPNCNG